MSASGNCSDHKEMHTDIIITKTIVERLDNNITDLYKKNEDRGKTITKNNNKVIDKLNKLELHFIKQESARDRRKLDNFKKTGFSLLKIAGWIIVAGLTGGVSFATAYAAMLKYWR